MFGNRLPFLILLCFWSILVIDFNILFQFLNGLYCRRGALAATVKLLPYDLVVKGLSHKNNLLQCR